MALSFNRVKWIPVIAMILFAPACSDKPHLVTRSATEFFVQDYNPPHLDVLWVIDDRSPMKRTANHLVSEASAFFQRLDSSASQYRMAFTTADMAYNRGALKSSVPITKSTGDLASRTALFATIFENIINLKTGGLSQGIAAAITTLENGFQPRPNVPLVIVFVSDSYDASPAPDSQHDKLHFFATRLVSLTSNSADLIRVYSLNYTEGGDRCATAYDSDLDRDVDNTGNLYTQLSNRLGGTTGDLCANFAATIDLSGIRLKQLPRRFRLSQTPVGSLNVSFIREGKSVSGPAWSYDHHNNELVFETTPNEGITIQVSIN